MKISANWIREQLSDAIPDNTSDHNIADTLTAIGLEVEGVELLGVELDEQIVVAEIISAEQHPNADRLRICQVNDGSGDAKQIVCGAPNARVGLRAPLARVGSKLPGGLKIKKGKLRGELSMGMLCSASELGLPESVDGLLALDASTDLGQSLQSVYGDQRDSLIEISITPNRGDCLSLRGICRDLAAVYRCKAGLASEPNAEPAIRAVSATHDTALDVELRAPEACPLYLARVISGIDPAASTPDWLVRRLEACGLRAISPVVDVTNLVMIELGQPMHGFDRAAIDGGIVVRWAEPQEPLTLLGGREVELDADMLVIADHHKVLAVGGVMGGEHSGIDDQTRDIVLESAWFAPDAVLGRMRRLGLSTDAGQRFERGVDPVLAKAAIERATALVLEICGGEPGPVTVGGQPKDNRKQFVFDPSQVERLLGKSIADEELLRILRSLGLEVETGDTSWAVRSPTWRFDIAHGWDLVEEVARIHGLDSLPTRAPRPIARSGNFQEARLAQRRLADLLIDRGYHELINFAFVDAEQQALCYGDDPAQVLLANPIASELSVMRLGLLPSLLMSAERNLHRQQETLRLFEIGNTYRRDGKDYAEEARLGMVLAGPVNDRQFDGKIRSADFFDLKGDLQLLFALEAAGDVLEFVAEAYPALHPGRSARIDKNGKTIGCIGQIHPTLQERFDIEADVLVAEFSLEALAGRRVPRFQPYSRYPLVRRDLALLVGDDIPAQRVIDAILDQQATILTDVAVFDVYRGKGVVNGCYSLALGLTFQSKSSNLTDQEVESCLQSLVQGVTELTGASVR
ncbi:phenylalanine--tRNA ligase subunit beta [Gammaproteobacteria bacterium]|nr:phenylalanine--tRNA ligase subunit beta [Gammaproteobacteria bacterium]